MNGTPKLLTEKNIPEHLKTDATMITLECVDAKANTIVRSNLEGFAFFREEGEKESKRFFVKMTKGTYKQLEKYVEKKD